MENLFSLYCKHSNAILVALFIVAMAIVVFDLFVTLFTILYQNVLYKKRRAKYDAGYTPFCSVILPCKGIPKNFGNNLRAFLQLDYPDFEVIYTVESEDDAAVPEIKKIMAEDARVKFAVAGLATQCAQKNHNMLAALKLVSDKSEVFVFADSDIKPAKEWLREIVLPLQDKKVTVTTGFRWLLSSVGSVGELCHAYVNIFIYVCFCSACYFGGVGLWGGTMAIRRKDYDDLGVGDTWSRASVDDMSLSTLALKKKRKAVVVTTCLTQSDDLIPTVGATISWFERQTMYFKSYQRALWLFPTFFLSLFSGLFICWLPAAVAITLATDCSFWNAGGWVSVAFILGHTLTALFYTALGKMPFFGRFLLLQPFLRLTHVISYFKTWTTRTITWAGIRYRLKFNGDVLTLKR